MTYQVKLSSISSSLGSVKQIKDFIEAGFEYIKIKDERHEVGIVGNKVCFYNEKLCEWVEIVN